MHHSFTIILTSFLILSCDSENKEQNLVSNQYTQSENITSMHKSTASLDRMLVTTQSIVQDMDKMNKNLDAIFKAVTKCESDHECEVLKQAFAEKAAAERALRSQQ